MANCVFEINGGIIEFCPKPSPSSLERIFKLLIDPPMGKRFYFVYFSDDSCISFRNHLGVVVRCNVDISSCDASHTQHLFNEMRTLLKGEANKNINQLIDQLRSPFTVKSADGPEKALLQPTTERLYSGSTLTTITNNLANISIAVGISETNLTGCVDVVKGAREVGYIVTCQDASADYSLLQFLKHSPCYDTDGELRAVLNVGVVLRLSGTCKGDLPGKRTIPLKQRAESMQAALIQGAAPYTSYTLVDNMKVRGVATKATTRIVANELAYKVVQEESPIRCFTDQEIFRRYNLTREEIAQVNEFGTMGFEQGVSGSAFDKILDLDYGLKTVKFGDPRISLVDYSTV
jgi:hypothetical protein